jgi:aspartyl-tRNA(Asn)/glutamyl-tRNA(Gln) amidotransferase subunit A
VGLKPTYGLVSTTGVLPLSWSMDHVGPMTRTALDAAAMLQAIAGYDPQDAASIDVPVPDYCATIADATWPLRIGIPRDYFYEGLHPAIEAALDGALCVLKTLTGSQSDMGPLAADGTYSSVIDPSLTVQMAEAYAYHKEYISRNPELYQEGTVKRIRIGEGITAPAYIQSRRQLDEARHSVSRFFASVDLAITPTAPAPPFSIADLNEAGSARAKEILMLRNTRPFNVLGLPTISVACGFTRGGLPIGMQITGRPGGEGTVLRLAYAYEKATEWQQRSPNLG